MKMGWVPLSFLFSYHSFPSSVQPFTYIMDGGKEWVGSLCHGKDKKWRDPTWERNIEKIWHGGQIIEIRWKKPAISLRLFAPQIPGERGNSIPFMAREKVSMGREKELRQAIPVLSPHYSLFLCRIFLWSREDERRWGQEGQTGQFLRHENN